MNNAYFFQAVSALDAIGDTEYAFAEFREVKKDFDVGIYYIMTYGLLQAMYLQQDAIVNLGKALGKNIELPKELQEIRYLRDEAIGHPTQRRKVPGGKGVITYYHIVRATLNATGFQMLTTYSDGRDLEMGGASFENILNKQAKFATKMLNKIYEHIRSEENGYREKYMRDKLADIFHPTLDYIFQQVDRDIRDNYPKAHCKADFELIESAIDQFVKKV